MLDKNQKQSIGDDSVAVQAGRDANVTITQNIGYSEHEVERFVQIATHALQNNHDEQLKDLRENKLQIEKQLKEAVIALTCKSKDVNESEAFRSKYEKALNLVKEGETLVAENLFLEIENKELESIEKSTKKVIDAALNRGALAYMRNTNSAISAYRRVLELDPYNLIAKGQLSYLLLRTGKLSKAEELQHQILLLAKKLQDFTWIASSYSALGLTYFLMGKLNKSYDMQNKSLEIREDYGDTEGVISSCIEMVNLSLSKGDFKSAKMWVEKSISLSNDINHIELMARSNATKGIIFSTLNDIEVAEEAFIASLNYFKQSDDFEALAEAYGNLGILYKNKQEFPLAEEMFKSSIAIEESLSRKRGVAADLVNLANLYNEMGKYELALEKCNESLKLAKELSSKNALMLVHASLGGIYLNKHDMGESRKNYEISSRLCKEIGNPHDEAKQLVNLSMVLLELSERPVAVSNLKKALHLSNISNDFKLTKYIKNIIKEIT